MAEHHTHIWTEDVIGRMMCMQCGIVVKKDVEVPVPYRLITFMYLLMRDSLPTGEVERLLAEAEKASEPLYSSQFIASYAAHLAARLIKCDGNHAMPRCSDPECWQR